MSRLVNMFIFFHVSIHITCLTVPDAINIDNKGEVWGDQNRGKKLYTLNFPGLKKNRWGLNLFHS